MSVVIFLEQLLFTAAEAVHLGTKVKPIGQVLAEMAVAEGASALGIIDLNAAAAGAAGLETYCLTPAGMTSTLTRNYADPTNIVLPGNSQDFQSLHLAMRVHRSLLQNIGMADRGVQRARFMAVLKTQQRPAILIEGGYLSDRNEAKNIASPDYRQKLALAVAKALE